MVVPDIDIAKKCCQAAAVEWSQKLWVLKQFKEIGKRRQWIGARKALKNRCRHVLCHGETIKWVIREVKNWRDSAETDQAFPQPDRLFSLNHRETNISLW
jgi:hypothetical protein